jgi:DNA-binding CsgD family transcriptional regulator
MLAADGKTNREIAVQLFLSPKTVEWHLGHVYRKLGIRSRGKLARVLEQLDASPSFLQEKGGRQDDGPR